MRPAFVRVFVTCYATGTLTRAVVLSFPPSRNHKNPGRSGSRKGARPARGVRAPTLEGRSDKLEAAEDLMVVNGKTGVRPCAFGRNDA